MIDSPLETELLLPQVPNLKKWQQKVAVASAHDALFGMVTYPPTGSIMADIAFIAGSGPGVKEIEVYYRALPMPDGKVVCDLRGFNGRLKVTDNHTNPNLPERVLELPTDGSIYQPVIEAALTKLWYDRTRDHQDMRVQMGHMSDFPMKVFSYLVAQSLVTRNGLDAGILIKIQVLAAYHWYMMFVDAPATEEEAVVLRSKVGIIIARTLRFDINTVSEVLDGIILDGRLKSLAAAIVSSQFSIRLEKITSGVIATLLSGAFYGIPQAGPAMTVALEYPPVFLSMMYVAARERSFRDSIIGRVIRSQGRTENYTQFCQQINRLVSILGD